MAFVLPINLPTTVATRGKQNLFKNDNNVNFSKSSNFRPTFLRVRPTFVQVGRGRTARTLVERVGWNLFFAIQLGCYLISLYNSTNPTGTAVVQAASDLKNLVYNLVQVVRPTRATSVRVVRPRPTCTKVGRNLDGSCSFSKTQYHRRSWTVSVGHDAFQLSITWLVTCMPLATMVWIISNKATAFQSEKPWNHSRVCRQM